MTRRLALLIAALASCSRDPEIRERSVVVHSPRSCPVTASAAVSTIAAGGDYDSPLGRSPSSTAFLRDVGTRMNELPEGARSLVVDVTEGALGWSGISEVPTRGPVHVLVWRGPETCRLTRDVERRSGGTLGVIGRHFVVAGGRSPDGAQVPNTFVGDLATGIIERLPFGLNTRRSFATITPFGYPEEAGGLAGALVAGGQEPDAATPLQTAEIYMPKLGAPSDVGEFEAERIDLAEPRTEHGAIVLAGGETLLVGGRGAGGVLRTMEVVDPVSRRARTAGVALLRVARKRPNVMRLANGEILVAGGVDVNDVPIPTLEWFSADGARATKRPAELVTGKARAFVPLEAGGALAVIIPDTPTPDFQTVWRITADGTLEPATALDPATLDVVRLFPGSEGAPVLWTGRAWLRWAPWAGAFVAMPSAPTRGPAEDVPIANGDPGLALWLEDREGEGMAVVGFRFASRTRFDAVPRPLLVGGPDRFSPDRLAGSAVRFEPDRGLVLATGASAFLDDVTFADVDIELDVTSAPPIVVLRGESGAELEIGGAACAFGPVASRLAVSRRGGRISVRADDAPARDCPTSVDANARLAVGLRGPSSVAIGGARNIRVLRR